MQKICTRYAGRRNQPVEKTEFFHSFRHITSISRHMDAREAKEVEKYKST